MTLKQIAEQYITFLEQGDTKTVVSLFNNNGLVNSPLYGVKSAKEFYELLAEDTKTSVLEVNHIFEDIEAQKVALYFTFHWTLANNKKVSFNVVDILEFDEKKKIKLLTIIYDTIEARRIFNQLNA